MDTTPAPTLAPAAPARVTYRAHGITSVVLRMSAADLAAFGKRPDEPLELFGLTFHAEH